MSNPNNCLRHRAIFWFLAIMSSTLLIPVILFFPETLRALVGNGSKPAHGLNRTVWSIMADAVRRRRGKGGVEKMNQTQRDRKPGLVSLRDDTICSRDGCDITFQVAGCIEMCARERCCYHSLLQRALYSWSLRCCAYLSIIHCPCLRSVRLPPTLRKTNVDIGCIGLLQLATLSTVMEDTYGLSASQTGLC